MKISKYLGKYDFINYYTKQPAFWFFSNAEINAAINTLNAIDSIDEEDEESFDDEEGQEFDSYEFYKQQKEELKNIDKDNPQIIEGLIIDKKSREFIINEYSNISKVIDFESNEYKKYNQEEVAVLTETEFKANKNIIMFQPVFIYNNLITKPDAIVKIDNEIIVIETKCTTTAKRHHLLDLYFQYRLLTKINYLEDYYFNLNLCLVKYSYANKKEVPLVLTDSFCINSTATSTLKDHHIKSLVKLGKGVCPVSGYIESPINITNVCENNFIDFQNRMVLVNPKSSSSIEKIMERMMVDLDRFDFALDQLESHKKELMNTNQDVNIDKIKPSANEKSFWKKSDLFIPLKKHYYNLGYHAFLYSGNITKQTEDIITNMQPNEDVEKYFKKEKYSDYFLKSKNDVIVNKKQLSIGLIGVLIVSKSK